MKMRYYGKYRGKVEGNVDLTGRGRVEVSVEGIPSGSKMWAWPCVPYAGPSVGMHIVPPVGAAVWVEFEGGNPEHAIVAGAFWDQPMQVPVSLPPPLGNKVTVIKTEKFKLEVDNNEMTAALVIEMDAGPPAGKSSIRIDKSGMTITAAENTIKLEPGMVSINGTNLQVLK
jgi:hypothetical protein